MQIWNRISCSYSYCFLMAIFLTTSMMAKASSQSEVCLESLNEQVNKTLNDAKISEIEECSLKKADNVYLLKFPSFESALCKINSDDFSKTKIHFSINANSLPKGICLVRANNNLERDVDGDNIYIVRSVNNKTGGTILLPPTISIEATQLSGGNLVQVLVAHRPADKLLFSPTSEIITFPEGGGEVDIADQINDTALWYTPVKLENIQYSVAGTPPFDITILNNGLRISAGNDFKEGSLNITLKNAYGESQLITLDLKLKKRQELDPDLLKISMDLSLAYKLQADEQYLRLGTTIGRCNKKGQQNSDDSVSCNLYDAYEKVLEQLPDCEKYACASLSLADKQAFALIKSDVKYRQGLLIAGIPFFGGYRNLKLTTPHQELIKMKALLTRVIDTVDRIERWQWRSSDMKMRAAEVAAERTYVLGQIKAEEISSEIHRVTATNFDAVIEKNKARQRLLAEHLSQLSARAGNIANQQEQLTSKATGLIQSGIAAASGIPLDQVQAATKGDVEGILKGKLNALINEQGSAFAKDFIASSEVGQSISGAYNDLREKEAEIRKTVNDGKRAVDDVQSAVKEFQHKVNMARDINKVLSDKMARELYITLNSETKRKLDELVMQTKPIGAALEGKRLELLYGTKKPTEQIQVWLELVNKTTTTLKIDKDAKEFITSLKSGIDNKLQTRLDDSALRLATQQIAKIVHNELIDKKHIEKYKTWFWIMELYPNLLHRFEIENALKSASAETIKKWELLLMNPHDLKIDDSTKGLYIHMDGETLVFAVASNRKIEVSLKKMIEAEALEQRSMTANQISRFVEDFKDDLDTRYMLLIESALAGPEKFSETFEMRVADYAKTNRYRGSEFDKLRESLYNTKDKTQIRLSEFQREYIAAQMALSTALHEKTELVIEPAVHPLDHASESTSDVSPETSAAITMALNSAFPGAGIAFSLGQTYASMDANRQLLNQLNKEIVAAILDYHHIQDAIETAGVDASIAKLELQRSEAIRTASKAQLQQYGGIEDMALEEYKLEDVKLRLYRPYLFYNAEMLRERFDAFDRSLALWSNGTQETGFFVNQIMKDPRNTRLALDSEIHLFNWLNRDREATKTDPYHVLNHWKQLISLAEDYCADYGCKPGDGKLGKVGATVPVRLIADLAGGGQMDSFRAWVKQDGRNNSFDFSLSLSRANRLIPREFVNVRLLEINIVPIDREGRMLRGNMVKLQHSGFSKIPLIDKLTGSIEQRSERLLMSSKLPPSNAAPFDITSLVERFQSQVSLESLLPLRGFEGYGLFGQYDVSIHDMPGIERVHDFEVQLAYIYQEPTDFLTEADVFEFLMEKELAKCEKKEKTSDFASGYVKENINSCKPVIELFSQKVDINDETGAVSCDIKNSVKIQLNDTADLTRLLELRKDKNPDGKGGITRVATGANCLSAEMPKVINIAVNDFQALRALKPRCSFRELLEAKNGIDLTKLTCFGD